MYVVIVTPTHIVLVENANVNTVTRATVIIATKVRVYLFIYYLNYQVYYLYIKSHSDGTFNHSSLRYRTRHIFNNSIPDKPVTNIESLHMYKNWRFHILDVFV